MSKPISITKALTAGVATAVTTNQVLVAAGDYVIDGTLASGGVATFTTGRRVLLTFVADETGKTYTIEGTDGLGRSISETVAGNAGGSASTLQDFLTVTRAHADNIPAGGVSFGTSAVGGTRWVPLDVNRNPFDVSLVVEVLGAAVDYTVQYTFDDLANQYVAAFPLRNTVKIPTPLDHPVLAALAATKDSNLAFPCTGVRCVINSGTGPVTFVVTQAGT